MGKTTIELTEQLYDYLLDVSLRDNALLRALRKHTDELESGADANLGGSRAVHGAATQTHAGQSALLKLALLPAIAPW